MKKTLCIILSFLLLFASCGESETIEADNTDSTVSEISQMVKFDTSEINLSGDNIGTTEEVSEESASDVPLTISDFVVNEIGTFYNGVARFRICDTYSVIIDETTATSQGGFAGYGYIDEIGTVLLEPVYTSLPLKCEYPVFATYNTTDGNTKDSHSVYLYPGNENFNFTVQNNMDKFAESARNGMFWVRSVEQKLSGNVYTMTYYDENGTEVFSIENAMDLDNGRSDFNEYGYALVSINGIGRMIDKEGNIVELKHENGGKITIDSGNATINDIDIKSIKEGDIVYADLTYTYEYYGKQQQSKNDYWLKIDYSEHTYKELVCDFTINYISKNYIYNTSEKTSYFTDTFSKICEFTSISEFEGVSRYNQSKVSEDFICFILTNKDNVKFAAVAELSGKITMQPTTDISFGAIGAYDDVPSYFYDGLCPAKDPESGLWGYIDSIGYWKIIPQFKSVSNFSDGRAFVNTFYENYSEYHGAVIDTNGDIVFEY